MKKALALQRLVDLVSSNGRVSEMLITRPALKTNMMLITGPALKTSIGLLALLGGSWTVDGYAIVGRGAISLDLLTLLFS